MQHHWATLKTEWNYRHWRLTPHQLWLGHPPSHFGHRITWVGQTFKRSLSLAPTPVTRVKTQQPLGEPLIRPLRRSTTHPPPLAITCQLGLSLLRHNTPPSGLKAQAAIEVRAALSQQVRYLRLDLDLQRLGTHQFASSRRIWSLDSAKIPQWWKCSWQHDLSTSVSQSPQARLSAPCCSKASFFACKT